MSLKLWLGLGAGLVLMVLSLGLAAQQSANELKLDSFSTQPAPTLPI